MATENTAAQLIETAKVILEHTYDAEMLACECGRACLLPDHAVQCCAPHPRQQRMIGHRIVELHRNGDCCGDCPICDIEDAQAADADGGA